jgi:hypothetical protein
MMRISRMGQAYEVPSVGPCKMVVMQFMVKGSKAEKVSTVSVGALM